MPIRTPSRATSLVRERLPRRIVAVAAVAAVVAASVLATGAGAQAATTGTLDQSNLPQGTNMINNGTNGQTFTPTLGGLVTDIDVNVGYVWSASGSVSLTVETVNAQGVGSGTVLGSGSVTFTSTGWLSIPVTSTAPIAAGTKYAFMMQVAGGYLNFTHPGTSPDAYPGGDMVYGSSAYPGYDLAFREYVTPSGSISGTPPTGVAANHAYSYSYTVGGAPAPTLSVTSGSLPAGLTLSQTGVLSGTPTSIGSSTFTIHAENTYGSQDVTSTVVVREAQAPGSPTGVTATAGSSSAHVTWTAPTTTGDDAVANYAVTSTPGGLTAAADGTEATVTGLIPGTAYTFAVTATSASGTGAASGASNSVTPYTPPTVPTAFTVTLKWAAPTSNGYSVLTGYTISQSIDGGAYSQVVAPAAGDTSASLTGLNNGSTYTFQIAAVNAAGTGPAATSSATTPFGLASSPLTPLTTAADSAVDLSWTAPSSDNGSTVTGYDVQHSTDGTNWTDDGISTGLTSTFTGLTNGTEYSFRVAAINDAGTGPWSNVVTATPVAIASAPTSVTVVPGDASAVVSWNTPADNGGMTITGYDVSYRVAGSTGMWMTGATGVSSPVTVTGLRNGTKYEFRVAAVNAVGTGAESSTVDSTPFVFQPSALEASTPLVGKTISVGDHVKFNATGLPVGSTVTIQLDSTIVTLATVTMAVLIGAFLLVASRRRRA